MNPSTADLRRLLAEASAAPWTSMRVGNQYVGTRYLPTATVVGASKIPQLPRPWNPHAVISFMTLDAAEESRFFDADADLIVALRNHAEALLDVADAAREVRQLADVADMDGANFECRGCSWVAPLTKSGQLQHRPGAKCCVEALDRALAALTGGTTDASK